MPDVAHEIFGEMRYLTPEENEKKRNMYRKMSVSVEAKSDEKENRKSRGLYNWLFADLDELIDCDFNESEVQEDDR